MSTAVPRVLALTGVAAVHAGVLLLLVTLTRTQLVRTETESPVLFVLLQPRELQRPVRGASMRRPTPGAGEAPAAGSETLPPAAAAPGGAIDWAAEATGAAARGIEGERKRRRQITALAPVPSAMFAVPPKPPQFHWDSSRTHRLDGFPVFATVVHLNERCTLVLFVIFPMGGCALGEIPVRGDLFEHLHNPEDLDRLP